jgi:prevent-host-death family protein
LRVVPGHNPTHDYLVGQEQDVNSIKLADAKSHLSELIDRVEAGASIEITRRGKPSALLIGVTKQFKPIDLSMLQALTAQMPFQSDSAEEFVRAMRDSDRF